MDENENEIIERMKSIQVEIAVKIFKEHLINILTKTFEKSISKKFLITHEIDNDFELKIYHCMLPKEFFDYLTVASKLYNYIVYPFQDGFLFTFVIKKDKIDYIKRVMEF